MKKGIIGKKLGMTQVFDQNGNVIPVTVIEAGPCLEPPCAGRIRSTSVRYGREL